MPIAPEDRDTLLRLTALFRDKDKGERAAYLAAELIESLGETWDRLLVEPQPPPLADTDWERRQRDCSSWRRLRGRVLEVRPIGGWAAPDAKWWGCIDGVDVGPRGKPHIARSEAEMRTILEAATP